MVENQNNTELNKTEAYFLSQSSSSWLIYLYSQNYLGVGSFHLIIIPSLGVALDPMVQDAYPHPMSAL